jgi:signal transduction histidine kinase
LALLAQELRKLVQTATVAVRVLKGGNVGLAGATGAVLDRSLIGLRNVIDHSLADVRVMAGMPRRELISLPQFISEVHSVASLEARARECELVVRASGIGLAVEADREMLAAALGSLLHNAFKSTQRGSDVLLAASSREDRVLIDVEDPCNGLPAAAATDRTALAICRRSVEANDGRLRVRQLRGTARVFTIDLPRRSF